MLTEAVLVAAIAFGIQDAEAMWAGPPPCGTPRVHAWATTTERWYAVTDRAACTIYVNRRLLRELEDPRFVCAAIVHEGGHLRGHEHVGDDHNVMYPMLINSTPGCDASWRRPLVCRGRGLRARCFNVWMPARRLLGQDQVPRRVGQRR